MHFVDQWLLMVGFSGQDACFDLNLMSNMGNKLKVWPQLETPDLKGT